MAAVTAELPTVGWTGVEKSDNVYLYSAPDPEKCEESHSYLLISFRDSLDRIDFYRASFENLAELESRTVGGVELSGRSYRYVGMDWIEYYGEVKDGVWVSVKLTGVAFSPGTETEAIFESLTFAAE